MNFSVDKFLKFVEKWFPADRQLIEHTIEWVHLYFDNKYSLVLSPREHTKSTTIRKILLFLICEWLDVRILIAAHKEQLAKSFSRDIMRHLEREELQKEYGYKIGKPWTRTEAFITTEIIRPHATATLNSGSRGRSHRGTVRHHRDGRPPDKEEPAHREAERGDKRVDRGGAISCP
jgi:hypothetical protein